MPVFVLLSRFVLFKLNKNGKQEAVKRSVKKRFSYYHCKKTYKLAKIGKEIRVILKKRDVRDCQIKPGSWLKSRLLV